MAVSEAPVDYVSAPASYEELYRMYYNYVVSLVRRMGIDEDRKEDVASSILLRFYERDFLAKFDPSLVFSYNGEKRPARFKSFLSKFVIIYVRSHREKQINRARRELLICDSPIDDSSWLDFFGGRVQGPEDDVIEMLSEQELVADLRRHLTTIPRRSVHDMCDLPAVFDVLVEQIREYGRYDVAQLKVHFGVSATSMHSWLWWLRANLAEYLRRPLPAKRPRTVRR